MKNIKVTIKILIVILCNDTMVTLRPTDERRAVCSNTHIQKIRLSCSFPVLCLSFEMFLSSIVEWLAVCSFFSLLTIPLSFAPSSLFILLESGNWVGRHWSLKPNAFKCLSPLIANSTKCHPANLVPIPLRQVASSYYCLWLHSILWSFYLSLRCSPFDFSGTPWGHSNLNSFPVSFLNILK